MRDIEELVQNIEKYKNVTIQQKFKSNKNTVAYVTDDSKPRIFKWYVPGLKRNMETEYTILKKGSSKLSMPAVHEMDPENNLLIMTYVTGKNLCDVVNDEKIDIKEKQKLMFLLGDWFAQFHNYFKTADQFRIRGDSILRNFLISDHIWGLDFEESRIGKPIEDIAGMCSSILSTDPMFTDEKFQLCTTFIESYKSSVKWSLDNMSDEIAYALLEKIQWRPEEEETLRKYAKRIRKQGLR
jgi:tRNA A-37 threonylcarbamoyl transferase component Bud32